MYDILRHPDLWTDAACADPWIDPEIFFAKETERQAVAICDACPLKAMCAEYAVTNEMEYGVWGGLNEEQRKKLNKHKPMKRRKK